MFEDMLMLLTMIVAVVVAILRLIDGLRPAPLPP